MTLIVPALDLVARRDLADYEALMARVRGAADRGRPLDLEHSEASSVRGIGHGREALGWIGAFVAIVIVTVLFAVIPSDAVAWSWQLFAAVCLLLAGPFGGYYLEAVRIRNGLKRGKGRSQFLTPRATRSLTAPWPGTLRTTGLIWLTGLSGLGAIALWNLMT